MMMNRRGRKKVENWMDIACRWMLITEAEGKSGLFPPTSCTDTFTPQTIPTYANEGCLARGRQCTTRQVLSKQIY